MNGELPGIGKGRAMGQVTVPKGCCALVTTYHLSCQSQPAMVTLQTTTGHPGVHRKLDWEHRALSVWTMKPLVWNVKPLT